MSRSWLDNRDVGLQGPRAAMSQLCERLDRIARSWVSDRSLCNSACSFVSTACRVRWPSAS